MSQPAQQDENFSPQKKRSKNYLVVPRQPLREVDVEISATIVCVLRGHAGQRTLPAIEDEDKGLQKHDAGHPGHQTVPICPAQYGYREDARRQKRPDYGVHCFNRLKMSQD